LNVQTKNVRSLINVFSAAMTLATCLVGVKIQIACHTITLRCRRKRQSCQKDPPSRMGAEHQKGENEVIRINNPNEAPVMLHSTHADTTLFEKIFPDINQLN
jgi:hypothetical protein